jgi:hypothetical protein
MQSHHTNNETIIDNPADLELNKPSKSRFLFVLVFFSIFIFSWAGCYNLYQHKFVKHTPEVPGNTQYEPVYK